MSALLAQQRRGWAEPEFQETRPSFHWPQEAWLPPTAAWRVVPPPSGEPEAAQHPLCLYHDLTTAAWLDEDTDAVDRQSWALARLVCAAALAVGALGLASYLLG